MESWMATTPFAHQDRFFYAYRDKAAHGYLWEQGTGKTKAILDKTAHLFLRDVIDALVIIAPNGVHRNWIERELPKHMTIPSNVALWVPGMTKFRHDMLEAFITPQPSGERRLQVLALNIEALQRKTSRVIPYLFRFLRRWRTHLVVDESSGIKTPSATRTRTVLRLRDHAVCRSIATGTPVTQGPLDLFSQFQFLQNGSLGHTSWVTFKSHYAEWVQERHPSGLMIRDHQTGRMIEKRYPKLVCYRNLDELRERMAQFSSTVRKSECLDLPPKVYIVRPVPGTPEQMALYEKVKKEVLIWLRENESLTIRHVLTRLLRLSQVTGGFIASDTEDEAQPIGDNPKIASLLGIVQEMGDGDKLIVWARFLPELRLIERTLKDNFGHESVARWWGDVKEKERSRELDLFMGDERCRFFVGQQHSGGYGLTLTAANHVAYFSNDFSLEARLQSEDRAHRIGQTRSVTYYDLVMPGTIDEKLLKVLGDKLDVANYFKSPVEAARWIE